MELHWSSIEPHGKVRTVYGKELNIYMERNIRVE